MKRDSDPVAPRTTSGISGHDRLLAGLRRAAPDAIFVVVLLAAGFKFCAGLEGTLEVSMPDETTSLARGLEMRDHGPPPAAYSPLYAAWYAFLSWFRPDPLELYFLNMRLLTVLLPLALYGTLRRYGVSCLASLGLAFYLLLCAVNLQVWPKVSHFAVLWVLLAFSMASAPASAWRNAGMCIALLAAAYARPELFVSFLLVLGGAMLIAARGFRARPAKEAVALFVVALVAVLAIALLGAPVGGEGGRDLLAFGQHFALNWVRWTGAQASGWNDWSALLEEGFGPVTSVRQAFFANPALFLRHLGANLARLPTSLLDVYSYHANLFLPPSLQRLEAYSLVGAAAVGLLWTRKRWLPRLRWRGSGAGAAALVGFAVCVPAFLAIVVIHPRLHYLLLPGVAIVVLVAALMRTTSPPSRPTLPMTVAVGAAFVAMAPTAAELVGNAPRPAYETIRLAKRLALEGDVNLLEGAGYCVYLGPNFHRVDPNDKEGSFADFLTDRRVNMIVFTDRHANGRRYSDDPTWLDFLDHFEERGFAAAMVPGTNHHLLVDRRLIPVGRLSVPAASRPLEEEPR